MSFNFGTIQSGNIQIGNGNVVNNDNRGSSFIQNNVRKKPIKENPTECFGCGYVNKIEDTVCIYCGRHK
jgi:hypothetical protein